MKVLVATDDVGFRASLCAEYRRRGFDVEAGTEALFRQDQTFDLIHCHWPEELCRWRARPNSFQARRVIDTLDGRREQSTLICSVHNLLPHASTPADFEAVAYYRAFYERMHHIGHFSETSRSRVTALFPESAGERHFSHGLNLFDDLKVLSPGREAARKALGLGPHHFAILAFGQLRSVDELQLIHSGLRKVQNVKPVVLMCARPVFAVEASTTKALHHLRHELWCLRHASYRVRGHVEDRLSATVFEAADALVIPRLGQHLNSGLLPLAMTFGTPMVAPNYGLYREYLSNTPNELYLPGDPSSLASAVERVADRSIEQVRHANLALASGFGWRQAVERILERVADPSGRGESFAVA